MDLAFFQFHSKNTLKVSLRAKNLVPEKKTYALAEAANEWESLPGDIATAIYAPDNIPLSSPSISPKSSPV